MAIKDIIELMLISAAMRVENDLAFYKDVNTSTHYPLRKTNQKQYRKLCRQNHSMYKSKKHRSKN